MTLRYCLRRLNKLTKWRHQLEKLDEYCKNIIHIIQLQGGHHRPSKANKTTQLENFIDFKYFGTPKDIKLRKTPAWRVCSELSKIWKFNLHRGSKQRVFAATVNSVLLYACEAWRVTAELSKRSWMLHYNGIQRSLEATYDQQGVVCGYTPDN